jgi:hypothetical protein
VRVDRKRDAAIAVPAAIRRTTPIFSTVVILVNATWTYLVARIDSPRQKWCDSFVVDALAELWCRSDSKRR